MLMQQYLSIMSVCDHLRFSYLLQLLGMKLWNVYEFSETHVNKGIVDQTL